MRELKLNDVAVISGGSDALLDASPETWAKWASAYWGAGMGAAFGKGLSTYTVSGFTVGTWAGTIAGAAVGATVGYAVGRLTADYLIPLVAS